MSEDQIPPIAPSNRDKLYGIAKFAIAAASTGASIATGYSSKFISDKFD